jgi:hypothetical protein
MTRRHSPFRLPPRWRWTMWHFIGLAGGGTAAALVLQWEKIPFAECVPLAVLPGLNAVVYWFHRCVFKANAPCRRDPDSRRNRS